VKDVMPEASLRRICRVLAVTRSTLYAETEEAGAVEAAPDGEAPAPAQRSDTDPVVARIKELIEQHPTYGYRRIWALLRKGDTLVINRKRVYRLMRTRGWMVTQRSVAPKPRVKKKRSRVEVSDKRWAMDVTHFYCGEDGWAHLTAVIDCHDRELIGYELALRGRAQEAERALEMACLARFGTVRPSGPTPTLRSDNGLIFQSKRFREACRFYRIEQEFITPYSPEQNGLVERFFRSFKEECVWQHNFTSFEEAKQVITTWLRWYNEERPHQALGYLSPREYRSVKVGGDPQPPDMRLRSEQLGSAANEVGALRAAA
jgi:putative transposase